MTLKQILAYQLFLFVLITSCNRATRTNLVRLSPSDSIQISIDSMTKQLNPSICYFEKNGKQIISLFNSFNGCVYFFNKSNASEEKVIYISRDSLKGIGKWKVIGFFATSLDSIFIYTAEFKLYLFDDFGRMKSSIDLSPFVDSTRRRFASSKSSFPSYVYGINLHSIINGKLYLTGLMDDTWNNTYINKSGTLIRADLSSGRTKYLSTYPSLYLHARWSIYYRLVFGDFIPKLNSFIFSFPADDNLYLKDTNGRDLSTVFAGSIYASSKILPLAKEGAKIIQVSRVSDDHYWANLSYRYILYDKYKDVFYRFVELPRSQSDSAEGFYKQYSIIILDKNLEIIGETKLQRGKIYIPGVMFISKEGLNILKLSSNEDILKFITFKLEHITTHEK